MWELFSLLGGLESMANLDGADQHVQLRQASSKALQLTRHPQGLEHRQREDWKDDARWATKAWAPCPSSSEQRSGEQLLAESGQGSCGLVPIEKWRTWCSPLWSIAFTREFVFVYLCIFICICVFVFVCGNLYLCICVFVYLYLYLCICICMCPM